MVPVFRKLLTWFYSVPVTLLSGLYSLDCSAFCPETI